MHCDIRLCIPPSKIRVNKIGRCTAPNVEQ
jgi:hypothetical protein